MNYGKAAVAPCGHAGEHIIGNFIKCVVGCEGKPPVPHRGQPGHVHMCACKPCVIRRRSANIVLRSDRGKTVATIPWDGIVNEMEFSPDTGALICHYWFMDESGDRIAAGNLEYDTFTGGKYKCVLEYKQDTGELKLKLTTVPLPATAQKTINTVAYPKMGFAPGFLAPNPVPAPPAPNPVPAPATSLAAFKSHLSNFPGLPFDSINVSQSGANYVYIDLLKFDSRIKSHIELMAKLKEIEAFCKANLAAGVMFEVTDCTMIGGVKHRIKSFRIHLKTGSKTLTDLDSHVQANYPNARFMHNGNDVSVSIPVNGYLFIWDERF